jgi:hypothetical protein
MVGGGMRDHDGGGWMGMVFAASVVVVIRGEAV